jgi:chromate transporter
MDRRVNDGAPTGEVLGAARPTSPDRPRPLALFLAFFRLGASAFGGPAMVSYIGELAVRRGWTSKEEFSEGVALCQSIPGATAMQSAAFVGLRAAGARGALAAYAGFGLPAVALMVAASAAYGHLAGLSRIQAGFQGFRAMIVALVANAAIDVTRRNVRTVIDAAVAVACATALYLRASPVAVIAAAAALEVLLHRRKPARASPGARPLAPVSFRTAALIAAAALVVVIALVALAPRLAALALLCMKVDALAFGGGFASVPLMFHEVVEVRSWLDARTFMDGIALGQITPGPIVVTATFVGYRVAGLAGAIVATVGVFLPSFLLVLATAPWFGRLRARPWFGHAMHGALLSFVGLLGFVSFQLGGAVQWSRGTGAVALLALTALRAGVDVLWIVLGSGAVAAFFW